MTEPPASGAAPPAGRFEGGAFVLPARVYYADTDAGGIVYHARFLDFAERARTELLRAVGWPLVDAEGAAFVVRRATLDWRAPGRLDDLLTVRTRALALGAASLTLEQSVLRGDETLCAVEVVLVRVAPGPDGLRPRRMPAALRAALAPIAAAVIAAEPAS